MEKDIRMMMKWAERGAEWQDATTKDVKRYMALLKGTQRDTHHLLIRCDKLGAGPNHPVRRKLENAADWLNGAEANLDTWEFTDMARGLVRALGFLEKTDVGLEKLAALHAKMKATEKRRGAEARVADKRARAKAKADAKTNAASTAGVSVENGKARSAFIAAQNLSAFDPASTLSAEAARLAGIDKSADSQESIAESLPAGAT